MIKPDSVDIIIPRPRYGLGKDMMDLVRLSRCKYFIRFDYDDSVDYKLIYSMLQELIYLNGHGANVGALYPSYMLLDGSSCRVVKQVQGSAVLYNREAFLEVGGYDETLDHQADLDFYIRFNKRYDYHHVNSACYVWKPGRSKTFTPEINVARKAILFKHGVRDEDVHHFGAYAYL